MRHIQTRTVYGLARCCNKCLVSCMDWLLYLRLPLFQGPCCIAAYAGLGCVTGGAPPPQITVEGDWTPWSSRVPQIEVETHMVAAADLVIPTIDTVRHESLLYTWLAEHKPIGSAHPGPQCKTPAPCSHFPSAS